MEFHPHLHSWFRGPALTFAARLCASAKPITWIWTPQSLIRPASHGLQTAGAYADGTLSASEASGRMPPPGYCFTQLPGV
jgi:hypothetical protein